ncbi:hypothetical protein RUM43_009498 [Polyplax serrata]|uniref:Uncharacterized protein n=1 Tax=Polyplax serrata TaxID=468196 RepID=A0AAN8NZP1_POLSC
MAAHCNAIEYAAFKEEKNYIVHDGKSRCNQNNTCNFSHRPETCDHDRYNGNGSYTSRKNKTSNVTLIRWTTNLTNPKKEELLLEKAKFASKKNRYSRPYTELYAQVRGPSNLVVTDTGGS